MPVCLAAISHQPRNSETPTSETYGPCDADNAQQSSGDSLPQRNQIHLHRRIHPALRDSRRTRSPRRGRPCRPPTPRRAAVDTKPRPPGRRRQTRTRVKTRTRVRVKTRKVGKGKGRSATCPARAARRLWRRPARPGLAESAGRTDREPQENSRIAPNRAGRGEKSRIAVVKQHATQRRE